VQIRQRRPRRALAGAEQLIVSRVEVGQQAPDAFLQGLVGDVRGSFRDPGKQVDQAAGLGAFGDGEHAARVALGPP
jgi:hypothetical protein